MFHMSYTTPFKGEVKTLKLTKHPFLHGLGHYRDTDGNLWDVHALVGSTNSSTGQAYINARPVGNHPNYYGSHNGASNEGHHAWNPYYFEVVEAPVETHA